MAPAMPPPAPAQKPGSTGSSISPLMLGCVVVPGVLLVLCGFGAFIGWQRFVSYGIATDFTDYQAKIRPMEIDDATKKPLLERLERLREKARANPISFWRWVDYDQSIDSMLVDGRLTPDELEAMGRELDRMEAEFR